MKLRLKAEVVELQSEEQSLLQQYRGFGVALLAILAGCCIAILGVNLDQLDRVSEAGHQNKCLHQSLSATITVVGIALQMFLSVSGIVGTHFAHKLSTHREKTVKFLQAWILLLESHSLAYKPTGCVRLLLWAHMNHREWSISELVNRHDQIKIQQEIKVISQTSNAVPAGMARKIFQHYVFPIFYTFFSIFLAITFFLLANYSRLCL